MRSLFHKTSITEEIERKFLLFCILIFLLCAGAGFLFYSIQKARDYWLLQSCEQFHSVTLAGQVVYCSPLYPTLY